MLGLSDWQENYSNYASMIGQVLGPRLDNLN